MNTDTDQEWGLAQDPVTHEIIAVPINEYPAGVAGELPYDIRKAFDLTQDPEYNRARTAGMATG